MRYTVKASANSRKIRSSRRVQKLRASGRGTRRTSASMNGWYSTNAEMAKNRATDAPMTWMTPANGRIDVARAQMEFIISTQSLPEGVKAQVRRDFDAAAAKIRTTAKEAGKDGKVTKEEAKDVRQDARTLVKDLRAKYGKDKKPAKDA